MFFRRKIDFRTFGILSGKFLTSSLQPQSMTIDLPKRSEKLWRFAILMKQLLSSSQTIPPVKTGNTLIQSKDKFNLSFENFERILSQSN